MGSSWHQRGPGLQSESSHADIVAGGPLLSELPAVSESGDSPPQIRGAGSATCQRQGRPADDCPEGASIDGAGSLKIAAMSVSRLEECIHTSVITYVKTVS